MLHVAPGCELRVAAVATVAKGHCPERLVYVSQLAMFSTLCGHGRMLCCQWQWHTRREGPSVVIQCHDSVRFVRGRSSVPVITNLFFALWNLQITLHLNHSRRRPVYRSCRVVTTYASTATSRCLRRPSRRSARTRAIVAPVRGSKRSVNADVL